MEISTLKDLKEAIKNIPNEILDKFGAGINAEGGEHVELLCWGNEEDVIADYHTQAKKYPQLKDISKWIENIAKEQRKFIINPEDETVTNRENPISSKEVTLGNSSQK